ncbi:MAG: hypothetical protein IBX60_07325 [Candidatus Aminicenantes bacterium]|nr:hypothetical protein [Candidatus Aminicenantes bacterium]
MKKNKSKYLIFFLAIAIVVGTIYNLLQFLSYQRSDGLAFEQFISKNTGKKLVTSCDYNIYFLVSPLDCNSCSEQFLTIDFVNNLNIIGDKKGISICINYVVSGDYSEKEKMEYISEIKSEVSVYIDKKNMAKTFLLKKYDTVRTPFFIILTRKGEIKYWQDFKPDERFGYRSIDKKLMRLMEEIL